MSPAWVLVSHLSALCFRAGRLGGLSHFAVSGVTNLWGGLQLHLGRETVHRTQAMFGELVLLFLPRS